MQEIVTAVVAPLIGAVLGGGGLASAIFARRNRRAEADYIDSKTLVNYQKVATDWITRLEEKVSSLEEEISRLKITIHQYEERIYSLLRELGRSE